MPPGAGGAGPAGFCMLTPTKIKERGRAKRESKMGSARGVFACPARVRCVGVCATAGAGARARVCAHGRIGHRRRACAARRASRVKLLARKRVVGVLGENRIRPSKKRKGTKERGWRTRRPRRRPGPPAPHARPRPPLAAAWWPCAPWRRSYPLSPLTRFRRPRRPPPLRPAPPPRARPAARPAFRAGTTIARPAARPPGGAVTGHR